jgi:hypothetical protein
MERNVSSPLGGSVFCQAPGNRTVQQSCDVIVESQTRLEERIERNELMKRGTERKGELRGYDNEFYPPMKQYK